MAEYRQYKTWLFCKEFCHEIVNIQQRTRIVFQYLFIAFPTKHKTYVGEAILMSTHNICFYGEL